MQLIKYLLLSARITWYCTSGLGRQKMQEINQPTDIT